MAWKTWENGGFRAKRTEENGEEKGFLIFFDWEV
jgi:hypothetical protein